MNKTLLKSLCELDYWKDRYKAENRTFKNDHYKLLMENIMDLTDESYFIGKFIADFGCGPRGSLAWIKNAAAKIGIDVLVPQYLNYFGPTMKTHDMIYVTASESWIPIPDGMIDVLFTINSFDHVASPRMMSKEILRIMKKGSLFCGLFNLNEPSTPTEPQSLTLNDVDKYFISKLEEPFMRIAYKTEPTYANLFSGNFLDQVDPDKSCVLWLKGIKN